jgi:hypothetical protein
MLTPAKSWGVPLKIFMKPIGIHVFVSNIHADTSDIVSLHPHHETSLLLAFAIHPRWRWTVVLYYQC